jgi:hypothetical protein
VYYGEFTNEEDVCREFHIKQANGTILFAAYETPCYEGYADVIFVSDGKLYHVEGSHCSCYGLENQWEPVETTTAALRHRLDKGYGPLLTYRTTVEIVLDEVERAGILRG